MRIRMTSIPVADSMKAFERYTTMFGFDKHIYDRDTGLAIVVSPLEPNGTTLLLEPIEQNDISKEYQSKLRMAGIPVITLGVEDLKSEYIRLINLDIKFKKEPTQEEWGWDSVFDDGCGNYVQLIQEG